MSAHKRLVSLRYWLLGRRYYVALQAMEFAASHHTGFRKDGVTPEFDHQVSIASYLRTLEASLIHPEETIAVAFLHDVPEDRGVSISEIEDLFGARVAAGAERMTKKFRGQSFDPDTLFANMADDPIASICKAGDRVHNLQTMVGVFTVEKQKAYVAEVEQRFLPMIRAARRRFPQQEAAYENVKHVLKSQIELIRASHAAQAA